MVERGVSTWSLHRTLGRFVAPDSAVGGGPFLHSVADRTGMALLDLPAELRRRGYDALHICHFHVPTRDAAYLNELRAALTEAGIALDALLIDDGDLSNAEEAGRHEAWIAGWLETAAALGARRARVSAGRSAPSPETLKASARRLARLAAACPAVRLVTENWLEMTPDARSVLAILDAAGPSVGLLIDLGNWRGPDKLAELAAIAPHAETCHAKCHFAGSEPDRADFLAGLRVLRDAGYDGPLALIYDGESPDEWAGLETEWTLAHAVFGSAAQASAGIP